MNREAIVANAALLAGDYWTQLPTAPDYLIAASGRVLSLVKKTPRFLRPIRMGNYRGLQLRHADGQLRKHYLHRLVLEAFYGPAPEGNEGAHLSGDKANNTLGNLAWVTPQENNDHKKLHGTNPAGERNPQSRLSAELVEAMRADRRSTGRPYHAIAKDYGVSTMTAYRAIVGQSWSQS